MSRPHNRSIGHGTAKRQPDPIAQDGWYLSVGLLWSSDRLHKQDQDQEQGPSHMARSVRPWRGQTPLVIGKRPPMAVGRISLRGIGHD